MQVLEEFSEGCKPFWIYKEDLELKRDFLYQKDHLTAEWHCYFNYPERQVYTKWETGSNIISCFYKIKIATNIIYPVALLA